MIDKFAFWLSGIVEDDPLPDEIDNILFLIKTNGSYKYIEMRGYEKEINFFKMFFRPLEAEYFNLLEFSKLGNKVFVYKVKNMIDEAFSSEDLKHQYRKRKIYLYYNNNLEYLFTI